MLVTLLECPAFYFKENLMSNQQLQRLQQDSAQLEMFVNKSKCSSTNQSFRQKNQASPNKSKCSSTKYMFSSNKSKCACKPSKTQMKKRPLSPCNIRDLDESSPKMKQIPLCDQS